MRYKNHLDAQDTLRRSILADLRRVLTHFPERAVLVAPEGVCFANGVLRALYPYPGDSPVGAGVSLTTGCYALEEIETTALITVLELLETGEMAFDPQATARPIREDEYTPITQIEGVTNAEFWECECPSRSIHRRKETIECPQCGIWEELAPDAITGEITTQYNVFTHSSQHQCIEPSTTVSKANGWNGPFSMTSSGD